MTAARKKQRQGRVAAAAPRSGWNWRLPAFLAAVFLLKLVVLLQLQHHPLLEPEGALDTAAYVSLARRVLGGDLWLGPGLYYVSPLYIYVLAALLGLSDSFTVVARRAGCARHRRRGVRLLDRTRLVRPARSVDRGGARRADG
jgi:hypothetical protein